MAPAALDGLNLDWVTPALAVGGSFATSVIPGLAAAGIKAVIDLRSEDQDDAAALARQGIAFLHLPTEDHCALGQEDMDAGVAFAFPRLAEGKVLVHCREGIGRSVTLCLCILTAMGMAPLQALRTIKTARIQASPSPPQFDAFATWLDRRNMDVPSFQAFAAIAYSHLG